MIGDRLLEASGAGSAVVGRDNHGSIVTTTDSRTFVGAGVAVATAVKDLTPVFRSVDLEHFTGRTWLDDRVAEFVATHEHGYLWVEGDAGVGKTAFAAHLVQRHSHVGHFARLTQGETTRVAAANLAGQLVVRHDLEEFTHGPGVLRAEALTPDGLESVLAHAAAGCRAAGEPLVLVVDGLDEAESEPGRLPWGLPDLLPDGVYVIGTYRTGHTPAAVSTHSALVRIDKDDPHHLADLRAFVETALTEPVLAAHMARDDIDPATAADTLERACGGVWVYLRYLLLELRTGTSGFTDFDRLPANLIGYYDQQITRWEREADWDTTGLPLLAALAAAREPVTRDTLTRWTHTTPQAARRWCDLLLRPFLDVIGPSRTRAYAVYHASAREFVRGQVPDLDRHPGGHRLATRAEELRDTATHTHTRIADHYLTGFGGLDAHLPRLALDPALAGADDGYVLRHLAHHLEAASTVERLHQLLACEHPRPDGAFNVWHTAHEEAGSTHHYIDDVNRARRLSEEATDAATSDGAATPLGREVRYTLIAASATHRHNSVHPALMTALVTAGVWTVERAHAHARTITSPSSRVEVLTRLLPHTPEETRRDAIVTDALSAVRATSHEIERAQTIERLAPFLPQDRVAEALTLVQSTAPDVFSTRSLIALASRIEEPEREALFATTLARMRARQNPEGRIGEPWPALGALGPYLSPRLLDEALTLADTFADPFVRAGTLAALAPFVDTAERSTLVTRVLDLARTLDDPREKAWALLTLAPHLAETEREPVLAQILDFLADTGLDGHEEEYLLVELVQFSSPAVQARALALTRGLPESRRWLMLRRYAPHLAPTLAVEAWDIARAIRDESKREWALAGVVPHLPVPFLREAVTAGRALKDPSSRAHVLASLLPRVGSHLLPEALSAARATTGGWTRTTRLGELVEHAPKAEREQILTEAFAAAHSIDRTSVRIQELERLAPHFPATLLPHALSSTLSIADEDNHASAMATLAQHTDGRARETILARALTVARTATRPATRAQALWELRPHLAEPERDRILTECLTFARTCTDSASRASMLRRLTPHVPDLLPEALTAAQAIKDDASRTHALTRLLPHLQAPAREAVLHDLADNVESHYALKNLAPHLPPRLLPRALTAARALPRIYRVQAVASVAPHIAEPERETLFDEVLNACMIDADLGGSAPANSLESLAAHLPLHLLPRALSVARAIRYPRDRVWALTLLLPRLEGPDFDTTLAEILTALPLAGDEQSRSLRHLAPHLPPHDLTRTLLALPSSVSGTATAALWQRTPNLGTPPRRQRLRLLRRALGRSARPDVLAVLEATAGTLVDIGGAGVVAEVVEAMEDVRRWWP